MKRFFFLTTFVFLALFSAERVSAEYPVNAYLFYGEGCPHCASERQFLSQMKRQFLNEEKSPHQRFGLYEFEVYYNRANALLLQEVARALGADAGGVPFLVIGDEVFIGFGPGITDKQIAEKIDGCLRDGCPDSVAEIVGVAIPVSDPPDGPEETAPAATEPTASGSVGIQREKMITLPFLGETDISDFSLPVLAIVMGALDGFNPCAMWVLLFLISLLLGMTDKKRMWILGSAFIVASASVYFIFMAAWLNLILFIGVVLWVRILIGLLALGGGIYGIKEFIFNRTNSCKITDNENRREIFGRLKSTISQKNFLLALGGIVILAFMVNLVELICSAGLPAVYTQVLAMNNLPAWQYYFYILLYVFFFMLDDLLVFFAAMATLQMTGITTKYARYSRLLGGTVMLLIGLALLFRPEWIMF